MKKFSEISNEKILDGDKIKIEDILNKEVQIIGFKISESKYKKNESGKCLTLQFIDNDKKIVLFTGSDVLLEQLEKYGSELPFLTTIRKINKYFTLT